MELQRTRFNDKYFENIQTYYENGGKESGLELSPKEQELAERWMFADEKIREQKYKREQIARFIIGKFGVCRDTAYKDIVYAERLWSSSYPLNKRSLISARIEFLIVKINGAYLDKEFELAAKLEQTLQKYIKDYPDTAPPRAPKQMILNITNNILNVNMSAEEAYAKADAIIRHLEDNDDY